MEQSPHALPFSFPRRTLNLWGSHIRTYTRAGLTSIWLVCSGNTLTDTARAGWTNLPGVSQSIKQTSKINPPQATLLCLLPLMPAVCNLRCFRSGGFKSSFSPLLSVRAGAAHHLSQFLIHHKILQYPLFSLETSVRGM